MAEDRGVVRQIAWQDIFPGTILVSAVRRALNLRALFFAALGFVAMTAGWWVIEKMFDEEHRYGGLAPWATVEGIKDAPVHNLGTELGPVGPAPPETVSGWVWGSPLLQSWDMLSMPFVQLFNRDLTFKQFVYLLVCALWALVVWAFFGACISRMAAVALARDEQLSLREAVSFAASKWTAYFTAPLFPLLGATLLAIPLALFGLLLRFGAGVVIAGILWFLPLAAGVAMAVLLIGLFFGFPLMWATISTEGTDSFDALSRSYAYSYQRPLYYLLYALVAAVLGVLGALVIVMFAGAIIGLANWGVSWGSSAARLDEILTVRPDEHSMLATGATLIRFWIGVVITLAYSYLFSYFWTAATAIYLLLRRQVDATEIDEVFMPEQSDAYGLPPLKEDASGVPAPADDAAVAGNGGAGGTAGH